MEIFAWSIVKVLAGIHSLVIKNNPSHMTRNIAKVLQMSQVVSVYSVLKTAGYVDTTMFCCFKI